MQYARAYTRPNNQETGGKGDVLTDEKEVDNMVPSNSTTQQNMTKVKRRKNYSEVVIEDVTRKSEDVCVWGIP